MQKNADSQVQNRIVSGVTNFVRMIQSMYIEAIWRHRSETILARVMPVKREGLFESNREVSLKNTFAYYFHIFLRWG